MISKPAVIVVALGFAQMAWADLGKLIDENVTATRRSAQALTIPPGKAPARLWIHIRTQDQTTFAQEIYSRLTAVDLNGRKISAQPLQVVDNGPRNNELRFFRREDSVDAQELLKHLRRAIPNVQLKDLSAAYRGVESVGPGHYELWITPGVGGRAGK